MVLKRPASAVPANCSTIDATGELPLMLMNLYDTWLLVIIQTTIRESDTLPTELRYPNEHLVTSEGRFTYIIYCLIVCISVTTVGCYYYYYYYY